jgi:formylglycine-generating enzyme required for sulfatase activity
MTHSTFIPSTGFRNILWGTRLRDMPWSWSNEGISAPCLIRQDEDYSLFDIQASRLTYTFRHSVFYGVRIDYKGCSQNTRVLRALMGSYRPTERIDHHGAYDRSWQTADTSIWMTLASEHDAHGCIYLWGRIRVFPEDEKRPVYLARPPEHNSFSVPYVPRHYVCYRASGPVTIDGKLDEKAWRDAQWMQLFEDHQAPYGPPPWKTTRAKMIYDDEFVYFGAELQEENVWGSLTDRDCVIYFDNDFEIFLNPTSDGVGYYEFEINPLNVVWDMFHETDYHRGSALHTDYDVTGLRHAVHVQGTLNYHHDEDIGWTVEIAWPLKSLLERNPRVSLPVKRGDLWRVNFSRVQYLHDYTNLYPAKLPESPCEDWVWQSTSTGDLHNPEMWGKVYFSDLTAGTVLDEELERGPAVRTIPPATDKMTDMVYYTPATCIIGPDPTDPLRSPAHEVSLDAFWMDRYQITVAEFTSFLNEGNHDQHYSTWMRLPEHCGIIKVKSGAYEVVSGRENHPVVYVSFEAAMAYAASKGQLLPTEAQWEYAARGKEGRIYAWGNAPVDPSYANYDFHYGGTTPVGSFPKGATPEGLFDMTGNVKEYTTSILDAYPGGDIMVFLGMRAPFIYKEHHEFNVVRGGAWTKQEACMAAAYRDTHGSHNLGFRCIKTP